MRFISRAIIVITFILAIVIGTQIYGYSSLKTDFSATGVSPQYNTDLDSIVESILNIFNGNFLDAASLFIQGLNIEGSLVLTNDSFIPIYLPAMEHEIMLNGIPTQNLIQTDSMWLAPKSTHSETFQILIDTADLPQVILNLLANGGNIDIAIDSSASLGAFAITKHSQQGANITNSLSSYASPATNCPSIASYRFSPAPITLGSSTNGSITITGGSAGTYTLVILKDISMGFDTVAATYTINHDGTTSSKTVSFTPGSSGVYYFHIEYNGSTIWSQPSDASRLTVNSATTAAFAVTSYGFSPDPITLGSSTNGSITITGGSAGTYTLVILKDISMGVDTVAATYTINHDGTTSSKTVSFTPGSSGVYYFHIEYNGSTIWSQPSDASRLTVNSATTAAFAVTSYGFSPDPITLGSSTNGSITITGGNAGTYTLVILKDISMGVDTVAATYTINHDGTTSSKTVSFTPGSSGVYYFHIEYNGSTIWSQPSDASRLTVTQ
jgi:hypothetical protein